MASTSLAYLFLNVYSKPATGSPELFSQNVFRISKQPKITRNIQA
jgi:hypothetical protein